MSPPPSLAAGAEAVPQEAGAQDSEQQHPFMLHAHACCPLPWHDAAVAQARAVQHLKSPQRRGAEPDVPGAWHLRSVAIQGAWHLWSVAIQGRVAGGVPLSLQLWQW